MNTDIKKTRLRLAKYLAMTGLCSRRAATRYIRDERIGIDGRLANHIDTVSLIETSDGLECVEEVSFNGKKLRPVEPKQYWILNKAIGTDCRLLADDPNSLIHLLPPGVRLYPVGRLDKDSCGLLLLTNDGELTQKLMHPDFGHSKTYRVRVERRYCNDFLIQMAQGVNYKDITTLPCSMARLSQDEFEIVLSQGLNRQIRRMSLACGYKVIELQRIAIQGLALGNLNTGEMRPLTPTELTALKQATLISVA